MKNYIKLSLLILSLTACQTTTTEVLPVEISNPTNPNARPTAAYPDLTIDGFYVNGPISLVGANFKIPLKVIEKNIGYKTAFQDSIYIYQRMPIGGGTYSDRLAGFFIRSNNLEPNFTQTLTGDIYVHKKYIDPKTRYVHLRVKADGGNRIVELDESNNFSNTIWNIYMPTF